MKWWYRLWRLDGDPGQRGAEAAEQLQRMERKLDVTVNDTMPRVRRATDNLAAEIARALGEPR